MDNGKLNIMPEVSIRVRKTSCSLVEMLNFSASLPNKELPPSIPTPFSASRTPKNDRKRWKCPSFYIKHCLNTGSLLPAIADFYDPTHDDTSWVEALEQRTEQSHINLAEISNLVEYFEHFSYLSEKHFGDRKATGLLSFVEANKLGCIFNIKKEVVSLVYDYWCKKRSLLQKPLIRKYLKKPSQDDTSPFVSFRPRSIERRTSTRTTNKNYRNDKSILLRIKTMRKDMKRFINLCSLVRNREEKKREQMLYDSLIFDINLFLIKQTKPDSVPSNNKLKTLFQALTPTIPYDSYIKFKNSQESSPGPFSNRIHISDFYTFFLDKKISRENLGKNEKERFYAEKERFYAEKESFYAEKERKGLKNLQRNLIPDGYDRSVVFSIDDCGDLCLNLFYYSDEPQNVLGESSLQLDRIIKLF